MSFISLFSFFSRFLPGSLLYRISAPRRRRVPSSCTSSGQLAFLTLLLAFAWVSCTPNLGGDNVGWSPVTAVFSEDPAAPARVYVASQLGSDLEELEARSGLDLGDDRRQVKVTALEDFGSGTPRVAWVYPALGSGAGLEGVFGPPAVSQELELLFIGAVDGHVYALSLETGQEGGGWKRVARDDPSRDPEPIIAAPVLAKVISSDTGPSSVLLIVSEDGNLYAFDAASGDELPWSPFRTEGKIWATPAVQNSVAYFGSQDHTVYAVDLRDGNELWRYQTGGAVVARPLIFDGKVIVGSFDKQLYALDADDGELEWTFQGQNWFWAGAVTDGETIFAPSMDGYVYALDPAGPAAGEPKEALWRHNMEGPVVATPALVPLGLVVGTSDGRMRLLSTSPSNLIDGEVVSNLPSLESGGLKTPLMAAAPPAPPSVGSEAPDLSVIRRYSVFVGGDNGIVRRISVTEGQDKEAVWCFDSALQRSCQ